MGMLDMILQSGLSGNMLESMAQKAGLDQSQIGDVVSKIAPVLLGKANANFKGEQDSTNLVNMINETDIDALEQDPELLADENKGNAMLNELMDDDAESESLAQNIGSQLGVDASSIKSLLPMIAPLVLGGLNKQANASGLGGADISGMSSMLSGMLDQDGDGKVDTNDIFSAIKKFFFKS